MLNLSETALRQLDADALTALLRAAPGTDSFKALWPVVAERETVDLPLVEALFDALDVGGDEVYRAWLDEQAKESAPTPMGLWLTACIREHLGEDALALPVWEVITGADGYGLPGEALLALARVQGRLVQPDAAYVSLRQALRLGIPDVDFWTRADRFYQRLSRKHPAPGQPLKVAVVGSSTTTFFAACLRMVAVRDGFAPTVYEGPYGAWRQEILDPDSGLYAFKPNVTVIATHGRDAALPAFAGEGEAPVEADAQLVDDFKNLWSLLLERCPCTVLQFAFDLPVPESGGALSASDPAGRIRRLRGLNEALRREAPAGVTLMDLEALAAAAPGKWSDARQWLMHKQHPAMAALPPLADACQSLIRAAMGAAKKVLVLDLDNTLWGGVIGEDGLAGIRVGPPHADGEAFVMLQYYARELKERGVLLAVCSKNNEADALLPFEQHEGMVLGLDDFAAFVANWEDKPANLRRIAEELNLGLESFVFVDDSPVERARVRRELPEVAVPELGSDPARYVEILDRGRWFEALSLSGEDRTRAAAYRAEATRRELASTATDVNAFLRQLRMRVSHGPFNENNLARVAQLVGKTNQFNLTTRRHSMEVLERFASSSTAWTQAFSLKDAYGDSGLVGVVVATLGGEKVWEVDTFLMSCRVIGRGLADYMAATLLRAARDNGVTRVTGLYIPTEKNAMVADFYFRYGFAARLDPAEQIRAGAPRHFVFEVQKQELPTVPDGLFEVVTAS
ncbi:HAD-IIIC family phosphatase [Ruficoccus sp. ZRK36]|uniref:HAD-IIIC family phosphatase n=1 Tax=Ruficoccus sp. ZRK36 TaxID=2866311 RepID=UPI001C73A16F|nr:HAD-IIIC family phosphatase [Ruficoccus sp. ZRK36]QYY36183.1 HAD-IIIC family phosphatase [Ruficoccus sp. ZRK36]